MEDQNVESLKRKREELLIMPELNAMEVWEPIRRQRICFGPISVRAFDPSKFPPEATVVVYLDGSYDTSAVHVVPVTSATSSALCPATPAASTSSSSPLSLDDIGLELSDPVIEESQPVVEHDGSKKKRRKVSKAAAALPASSSSTTRGDLVEVERLERYPATQPAFDWFLSPKQVKKSKKMKRIFLQNLLSFAQPWFGVGVIREEKKSKTLLPFEFVDVFSSSVLYSVKPLGFQSNCLVFPAKICFATAATSSQVVVTCTDFLKVKDGDLRYSMTVHPNHKSCKEIQFCLMMMLVLAFHQLRQWCRLNSCFSSLLDPLFEEWDTEHLKTILLQQWFLVFHQTLPRETLEVFFKRSNAFVQKIVSTLFASYPSCVC